jgi:hypothetical protein
MLEVIEKDRPWFKVGHFIEQIWHEKKCITWPKKFGKRKQEWNKACVEIEICPRKLNTPMKRK